jgi:hypothetical protein
MDELKMLNISSQRLGELKLIVWLGGSHSQRTFGLPGEEGLGRPDNLLLFL